MYTWLSLEDTQFFLYSVVFPASLPYATKKPGQFLPRVANPLRHLLLFGGENAAQAQPASFRKQKSVPPKEIATEVPAATITITATTTK